MLYRLSRFTLPMFCAALAVGCSEDDDPDTDTDSLDSELSFFVTSETNATGDLGGISGADATCDELATAVGAGGRTWRAYLSTETENARARIGNGPWINAAGAVVAADLDALHSLTGNAVLFVTESGAKVNGQWNGSNGMGGNPTNEHDILTGSAADGTLARNMEGEAVNCQNWTSASADFAAQVGHSDGMGPMMAMTPPNLASWNGAHANMDCSNTAPRGGAGRFYCFAAD